MGSESTTSGITHLTVLGNVHFKTWTALDHKANMLVIVYDGHTGRRVCFHLDYDVAALLVDKSAI